MMISRMLIVATLITATAAPALAQSKVFDVTGSAPQVCAVAQPTLTTGSMINIRNLDGDSLQIDRLVDPRTLTTNGASAEVSFSAVCTVPHRIVLESRGNGLWRNNASGGARTSGFADGVPYSAEITWGGVRERFEASALSRGANRRSTTVSDATVGDLKIALTIQAGASNGALNSPLLAGVYSDTLTITLEPQ
jgi:hypothetical protein